MHGHEDALDSAEAERRGRPLPHEKSGPTATATNLQAKAGNSAVDGLFAQRESQSPVLDVVGRGGGQPLEGAVRAEMEAGLGHDFSDVRIHTDAAASASAEAISAQAYTVGNDVVFQDGNFNPNSSDGKHILAHELAHVVQQRSGPVDGTQTGDGVAVSDPADRFEQEADATATAVVGAAVTLPSIAPELRSPGVSGERSSARPPRGPSLASPAVQRQSDAVGKMVPSPSMLTSHYGGIIAARTSFRQLMQEAQQILDGTRFHYNFINGIYSGCYGIHKEFLGQADEQEKQAAQYEEIFLGVASAVGTAVAPVLFPTLTAAVKGAQAAATKWTTDVKDAFGRLGPAVGWAAGKAQSWATDQLKAQTGVVGAGDGAAAPEAQHLIGLEVLTEVTATRDHIWLVADQVFDDALDAIRDVIDYTHGHAHPEMSAAQSISIAGDIERYCARFVADLAAPDGIVGQLRTMRDRRAAHPAPSWRRAEQDIWLAWLQQQGYLPWKKTVLINHFRDLGVLGRRLGAEGSRGFYWKANVAGNEDEDGRKSTSTTTLEPMSPAELDQRSHDPDSSKYPPLAELPEETAIKQAAAQVKPYWRQVLLLDP